MSEETSFLFSSDLFENERVDEITSVEINFFQIKNGKTTGSYGDTIDLMKVCDEFGMNKLPGV